MKDSSRRIFLKIGLTGATGVAFAGMASQSFTLESSLLVEPKDITIIDFGAVGDGKKLNTLVIQKAIDICAKKGGGRVIVPQGIFLTGSLKLRSKVNLHLQKGTVLQASPYFKDFPELLLRHEARFQKYLKRTLIYAVEENNISVSGEGILDGNALLDGTGEFKEQNAENPTLIWFDECNNVSVKDITFRRSVWWTQAYSRCSHVHVDHITVTENYFYNADGCDILDCEDFLVENCDINANDDGICLKGYTANGCNRGIIRNNKVRTLCN